MIHFALDTAVQFAKEFPRCSVTNDFSVASGTSGLDLGWKADELKRKHWKSSQTRQGQADVPQEIINDDLELADDTNQTSTKRRLLKELSARLRRDTQLGYAQRELEMQRLLMGKGARTKIAGVEKVNGGLGFEDEEDEDEIDARKGRRIKSVKKIDEELYKPRVYKWKMERKR